MTERKPTMIDIEQRDEMIARNVSMNASNWDVVTEVSRRYGLNNISAALRFIINEYIRLAAQEGRTN